MVADGYGKSDYTRAKQACLDAAVDTHTRIIGAIHKRHQWAYPFYAYFDLFAGPGVDDDGDVGSPLIVLSRIGRAGLSADAHLFEKNPRTAARLSDAVEPYRNGLDVIHVYNACCEDRLTFAIDEIARNGGLSSVYGLLYADPNGCEPWPLIGEAARRLRRVDVLLAFSATAHKREQGMKQSMRGTTPDRVLDKLDRVDKDLWFVREPMGQWQWSMLFGTNYPDYKEMRNAHFVRVDTPRGQEIMDRINLTRAELASQEVENQLALPLR